MLLFGKNITAPGDPLQPLSVERLYQGIVHPKQGFLDLVEQLRMVRSLDENQYRQLKKQLPYFVCGAFHPKIRRKENFASIEYFMFDLDHLAEAQLDRMVLQEKLWEQAPEVLLCFASPSGDGLKLMFRLSEPCRDQALFSAFYKLFARRFAEQWGLMEVMDFKTSDATRACFLSVDDRAFHRPDAQPVAIGDFIHDLDFGKAEKEIREAEKAIREQAGPAQKQAHDLADDVLARIKQKLNPSQRRPVAKEYFVPPEVDDALGLLGERLSELEMEIIQTAPISFGRKVRVKAGLHWAEINIFYGKKGFKVVKTTKSGSHPELAELAATAVEAMLTELKI